MTSMPGVVEYKPSILAMEGKFILEASTNSKPEIYPAITAEINAINAVGEGFPPLAAHYACIS